VADQKDSPKLNTGTPGYPIDPNAASNTKEMRDVKEARIRSVRAETSLSAEDPL
jgi:hypothetical protein